MGKETHHYKNADITVVWKPKACIHSALCWKGLGSVFHPKESPWIKMEGASTEQIIEQVQKCPSGALSYFRNDDTPAAEKKEAATEVSPALKVEVSPNGPYLIRSECLIVHGDGKEEIKSGTIALCRCGNSANKPYCDGAHRKIDFRG